ncbi:RNA ligase, Rnl2 family [uncultured Dokdonia sp.]|uniref:RNA ligase, Rnl2 family n=1 Tax=uncultured Dokdonia sp. TaxID=575653 RepID=UPI002603ADE3|nr:RNA ligase, Rnl2 family [uncultured Dokdonia sp.]
MFKKYNSIENTYREKVIEQIHLHGYGTDTFVVQEKVHGANFSFICDGKDVRVAKRTALIEEGEQFNNYRFVLEMYKVRILELFSLLKSDIPEVVVIHVYGELFGGSYGHPDVKKIPSMVKVQKGISYSPKNDFYAFDICVNQEKYLDVHQANSYFEKTGMFYAKTLFEGSLQDCLEYPNLFSTYIPLWLGYPEMETNFCEGVVIRPSKNSMFRNGSRVILKNKNEKWSEKSNVKKVVKPIEFTKDETILWNILHSYLTENRLINVQSKLGEFQIKTIGKTIGFFAKDALEDFTKEHRTLWDTIEKERRKVITKRLNVVSATLVKAMYL